MGRKTNRGLDGNQRQKVNAVKARSWDWLVEGGSMSVLKSALASDDEAFLRDTAGLILEGVETTADRVGKAVKSIKKRKDHA